MHKLINTVNHFFRIPAAKPCGIFVASQSLHRPGFHGIFSARIENIEQGMLNEEKKPTCDSRLLTFICQPVS